MNPINLSHQKLTTLIRHTLFVMFICYFPHITTEPLWIFMLFLTAIGYRLIADYFSYPPLPRWVRLFLIIGCLFLLNSNIHSSGFLIRVLLTFIILKCIEIHSIRDIKALILCNFFLIFSALMVIQALWIIVYLLIAIIANLSIMLELNTSQVTLKQMAGTSSRQLLIVIPISLLLFFIFPRLDPLWYVPTSSKNIGFDEQMSFGSVAESFSDDTPVMQITFHQKPILYGYWRGILLSFYDGKIWTPSLYQDTIFSPLPEINRSAADYEVILEPNQKKWLFYAGYPIASYPNLLFKSNHGLMRRNGETITQRFAYALKIQTPVYRALKPSEYTEATQLPFNTNPRLNAWAKTQFTKNHKDVKAFVSFLHDYIHQQSFWYTLTPPSLNYSTNQMDTFWFDTQQGFCEHYSSAVGFILRAAGIPARIVIGYQGGEWNPIAQALVLKQNDAHAWVEYWQEGAGWQTLDPTLFIAPERIDQTIRDRQTERLKQGVYLSFSELSWLQKIHYYLDSARLFSTRWLLFYNPNSQKNLLQSIGLGRWEKSELLQASVLCIAFFFIFLGLYYLWREKLTQDPLLLEYHLLQKEFRKFNIPTHPSVTLEQQCNLLLDHAPSLTSTVSSFMRRYEKLRLKQRNAYSKENKKETIKLFKNLREKLRKNNDKKTAG